MTKILQHDDLSTTPENNLFLFLESLRLKIVDGKLSDIDVYKNGIKISKFFKEYDFNSVYLDGSNIGLYLATRFYFFKDFFDREDLRNIISKCDLNRQNKDGWNIIIFILRNNKNQKLGFIKEDIIPMLDKLHTKKEKILGRDVAFLERDIAFFVLVNS